MRSAKRRIGHIRLVGFVGRICQIFIRPIGLIRPICLRRKKINLFAIFTILVLAPVALFIYFSNSNAEASWFDDSWTYRKSIAISAHTSAENSVYINLTGDNDIDTSDTTRFQSDCGDLRFTKQNGELLPYYIASGCGGASTVVHVFFDSFPAGAQTIYFYYGNPNAPNGFSSSDFATEASNYTIGSQGSEEKTTGPVGYWRFDEGTGSTAYNSSTKVYSSASVTGDGADGACTVSADTNITTASCAGRGTADAVNFSSTTNTAAGATSIVLTATSTGLAVGDEVLIINLMGSASDYSNVGKYETKTISSISTTTLSNDTLNFADGLSNGYDGTTQKIMVQRVPNYTTVTIDASQTMTAAAWDGSKGGVLFFKATGAVAVNGAISMSSKGYNNGQTYAGSRIFGGGGGGGGPQCCSWNPAGGSGGTAAGSGNAGGTGASGTTYIDGKTTYYTTGGGGGGGGGAAVGGNGSGTTAGSGSASSGIAGAGGAGGAGVASTSTDLWGGAGGGAANWGGAGGAGGGQGGRADGGYQGGGANGVASEHGNPTYSRGGGGGGGGYGTAGGGGYAGTGGNNGSAGQGGAGGAGSSNYGPGGGGAGGQTYGSATLSQIYMGSPGANAAANTPGGIVMVYGSTVTVDGSTGSIVANGSNQSGKSGAGSGGSVLIKGNTVSAGTTRVTASGGTSDAAASSGGAGGAGRIAIVSDSITGTTSPSANSSGITTTNVGTGAISGATWVEEGRCVIGKCLYFDGSNDSVSVAGTIPDVKTISFWLKPKTNGEDPIDLDGTHTITAASGTISANGFTNSTIYVNGVQSSTLTANTWQHIAVTTTDSSANASALKIGLVSSTYLNGFIDDVKLYNFTKTAAQIKADYASKNSAKGAGGVLGAKNQSYLSNGLVGYWKMDESSWTVNCSTGSITDSSGNGNNGKACPNSTGPSGGAVGKFGNGSSFDGTNDYVDAGDFDFGTSQSFTISSWIKRADTTTHPGMIISKGGNASGRFWFGYVDESSVNGTLWVNVYYGGANDHWMRVTNSFNDTNWHHLVWVVDKTNLKQTVYYDGIQAATGAITNGDNSAAGNMQIGTETTDNLYFKGSTDDVRIYNRAISPKEVSDLYNWAPGPIGYWDFEDGQGGTVTDKSQSGNNGSLSGASWSFGKNGKGLLFDGSDDRVSIGDNAAFQVGTAVTYEAWVYPTKAQRGHIINKWVSGSENKLLDFYANQTISFYLHNAFGGTELLSSSTIPLDKWSHVSATYNGSTAAIYINGVLDNSKNASGDVTDSTGTMYLGGNPDRAGEGNDFYFKGRFDEVKIYNYARTSKQIVEDMNAGHPSVGSPVGSAVGYWKFDEGADNRCVGGTNDTCNSGNGGSALDGAQSGMAVPATSTSGWTNSGKFGKALLFDGSNDIVSIPDNTANSITGNITLSAWVRRNTANTADGIIGKYKSDDNTRSYLLGVNTTYADFILSSNGTTTSAVTSSTAITAGNWFQIIATYDGAYMRIYVNGKLDAAPVAYSSGIYDSSNSLNIGNGDETYWPFDGTLDEVKIYNYALTQDEVKTDYNRGSSLVLGALSDNSSYQKQAANQEYCVPGDATSCAAPVGEWKFEEGSGTVLDTSGNGNNGTWAGTGTIHWTSGKYGKSGNFNGSDDSVSLGNPATFNFGTALTFEAWVYPTVAQDGYILDKWISGQEAKDLYVGSDRKIYFYLHNVFGGAALASASTIPLNRWSHISAVYTGSKAYIYINGKLDNQKDASGNVADSTGNLFIGRNPDRGAFEGTYLPFSGKIDQVRIFDYARSAAQVAWDYNRGAPVGHWKFNECQEATAYDSSGNGLHGTITIGASGEDTLGTCATASTAWGDGATGKYNASLNFDGIDDKVTVANAITSVESVSFWVKPATSTDSFIDLDGGTHYITASSGTVSATGFSTPTIYVNGVSGATLTGGAWNHIVVTTATSFNTTSSMTFGYKSAATADYFNGQMDEIRIYNYALTGTQVKLLYNENSAVRFGPNTGSP